MARIVLVVQPTPTGVNLTWYDGPASFPSYELPRKTLIAAADAARGALGPLVECYFSADACDANAASAKLAQSGYGLYQALFRPGAEQQVQATEIHKWLDKLQSQGAVETVEVVCDGVDPVPWNLVYDRKPDLSTFQIGGTDPSRWQPFWGLRYNLSGGRRVSPLRRYPILLNPRVVVVTDPMVIDNLPAESLELTALCKVNGWPLVQSRTEFAEVLRAGRPDILYWLGHTQTDPFGLVLGEDVITPDELRNLMERDTFEDSSEVFGGIAFLNACGTATGRQSESFLDALHPLGLSGYVVTEQSTVDTFAAPLGREFLSAFAVRGEPLGQVMRQLRGRVPLGLIYGSYCPPVLHVRWGNQGPQANDESVQVVLTSVASGTKLGRAAVASTIASLPLPAHPYRSLRAYGSGDRALFAGREDDVLRFTQLLDEPGTRLLILHGESGVGKTSFLRAGVMPYLERDCIGYRFARDRTSAEGDSILLVRATNDLISQLATALGAYCTQSLSFQTPLGEEVSADLSSVLRSALGGREGLDALRDTLRSDPSFLGQLLVDLSLPLPFTPILLIDQAEEVFTLSRTPADEENRSLALEMLRRAANGPAGFKIVVSLRTEYHGRFTDRLRKGTRNAGGMRDYLLTDFGLRALIEVIHRPTVSIPLEYASEVPVEKYGFRYAEGVVQEIARRARAYTINRQDSVLPLVQVICTQLYNRAKTRPDAMITLADLEAIGGVEGGMRANAESLVRRLFSHRVDQKAFKRLLGSGTTQLYIRQPDGTLTTALLPAEYLGSRWSGRMPFEQVLRTAGHGDWRLLRVNSLRIGGDEEERVYVSLGHDSLAKVAAGWHEELKRRTQLLKYAKVLVAVCILLAGAAFAGLVIQKRERAKGLVDNLLKANTAHAPGIIRAMDGYRMWVDVRLRKEYRNAGDKSRQRLHASLGLLPVDDAQVEYLYHRLLDAEADELPVIRDALASHKGDLLDKLWSVVEKRDKEEQRLRAASALASYDPENQRWTNVQDAVGNDLINVPLVHLGMWMDFLRPVRVKLLAPLSGIYGDPHRREIERSLATNILVNFAFDQPELLAELVMNADAQRFDLIFPLFLDGPEKGLPLLIEEIERKPPLDAKDEAKENLAKRQANAAVALLRIGRPEKAWSIFKHSNNPRARSYLIHSLSPLGASTGTIIKRLDEEPDATIRRALILTLGEFSEADLAIETRQALLLKLREMYRKASDPGLHAAAEWVLRTWKQESWLKQINEEWTKGNLNGDGCWAEVRKRNSHAPLSTPRWYVNGQGQTMVVIPGPVEFMQGSPETEVGRWEDEKQHAKRIGRTFAIAAKTVTLDQYRQFDKGWSQNSRMTDLPVVGASWYDATAYCNWLSKEEGIDASQWCYEIKGGLTKPKENFLSLSGYRLPTESEMEYATRAGAWTSRYYGESENLLAKYAWYHQNSQGKPCPVGRLKPNDLGLFDMLGNVYAWCEASYKEYPEGVEVSEDQEDRDTIDLSKGRVMHGGSFGVCAPFVRSAYRLSNGPSGRAGDNGIRLARTFLP